MAIKYTFKNSFNKLRACDQPIVKKEIMEALKITTDMAWSKRIRGLVMPTIKEYNDIENIFRKYKLKKVWEEINED